MIFNWPIRVYIEDTDVGGIVYYANYLKFMERARTEWLRTLGFSQEQLRHDNALFVVREVQIKYLKSARLDDELTISVALEQQRRVGFTLVQTVQRTINNKQEQLAVGRVDIVCMTQEGKPRSIPASIMQALQMPELPH